LPAAISGRPGQRSEASTGAGTDFTEMRRLTSSCHESCGALPTESTEPSTLSAVGRQALEAGLPRVEVQVLEFAERIILGHVHGLRMLVSMYGATAATICSCARAESSSAVTK